MSIVYSSMSISVDGFTAGVNQSFETPFGDNFDNKLLHKWMFEEPERQNHLKEIEEIIDAGAFIMGSNMYGPKDRRESAEWTGWWGNEPPYHGPVFVLTHKKRDSITMDGGTTFHFVTNGIESALEQAKEAAGDRNVSIAGGAHTVNQYLAAGHIDELRLHIIPVTIGKGTRLFEGVPNLRLEPIEVRGTSVVTHIRYNVVK